MAKWLKYLTAEQTFHRRMMMKTMPAQPHQVAGLLSKASQTQRVPDNNGLKGFPNMVSPSTNVSFHIIRAGRYWAGRYWIHNTYHIRGFTRDF